MRRLALLSLFALSIAACNDTKSGTTGSASTGTASAGGSAPACDSLNNAVVATADGVEIRGDEVESATNGQTFQLRQQIFEARRGWVQNEIAKRLVEREAKKEGLGLEEFLEKKTSAGSKPVTDTDVQMFYRANQAMMKKPDGTVATLDEVKDRIREHLDGQGKGQKRQEYLAKLIEDNQVKILMEPLDPPTVEVSVDDDPSKGPKTAPVTIVEFSDFQCPACRNADARIADLLKQFEGKVHFVYRDFPLTRHKDAMPASVAANCAKEQGKYWEFHELLFQNQNQLKPADFTRHAQTLKLDMEKFATCQQDPKWVAEVNKDLEDGEKAGVNSTPSFFVNGKLVPGGNIPEITRLIEKELAKAGS